MSHTTPTSTDHLAKGAVRLAEHPFVGIGFEAGTTFALTGENAGHWVEGAPTHQRVITDVSDAVVLAAFRAFHPDVDIRGLEEWDGDIVAGMRAAIAAAFAAAQEEEG